MSSLRWPHTWFCNLSELSESVAGSSVQTSVLLILVLLLVLELVCTSDPDTSVLCAGVDPPHTSDPGTSWWICNQIKLFVPTGQVSHWCRRFCLKTAIKQFPFWNSTLTSSLLVSIPRWIEIYWVVSVIEKSDLVPLHLATQVHWSQKDGGDDDDDHDDEGEGEV